MHFFYIDESGDTGRDLSNPDQPIMVIGGISLSDEKWNETQRQYNDCLNGFFNNSIPSDFELHAYDLLSPNGNGPFAGYSMQDRTEFVLKLLDLIISRSHDVHYIAFCKEKIRTTQCGLVLAFNPSRPYLLGFDYLLTYINWHLKNNLGRTSTGLVIIDEKENHHEDIEKILKNRRFETTAAHCIKKIVEFTYPVDSQKNPMVQLSDLVIFCIRRFLEIEHGYRNTWPQDAKNFYAKCFDKIQERVRRKSIIERNERGLKRLNEYLNEVKCTPVGQWKRKYQI